MVIVTKADLHRPDHAAGVIKCIDAYAADPLGASTPLTEQAKANLIPGLLATPSCTVLIALENDQVVGTAVTFLGFSTFMAKPRLNLHDLIVLKEHRGHGIGRKLIQAVTDLAIELGCGAVTLELRQDNGRARRLYRSMGFGDWLTPMEFWQKKL